jgi:thiol-disulfide isomerase/thioredoxin
VIPAGNDGTTRDVYLYDNVSAVVETGSDNSQLAIGTLVRCGENWRLLDVPAGLLDGDDLAGYFFQASLASRPPQADNSPNLDENVQKLIADLDAVDQQLSAADQEAQAKLNSKRADVLEQLVEAAKTADEKSVWIRQFADTVSAAVQTGAFPDGLGRLEKLVESLKADPSDKELLGYVKYRLVSADYGRKIQDPKADLTKVQDEWLEVLNTYIKDYPKTLEAAEAMIQIATASEFAGKESDAINWYTRITKEYEGTTPVAAKAAGAKRRLESVGKVLELQGTTGDGRAWKLATMRGKPVIIYYWASWCDPCKQDFPVLKNLQEKYKNRFTIVGINLDTDEDAFKKEVSTQKLQWTHVREPEGLDGKLANDLGVLTVPTMLLLDKTGKVINRNAHTTDLEKEIEKIVR